MKLAPVVRLVVLVIVLALLARIIIDNLGLVLIGVGLFFLAHWLFKRL